MLYLFIVETANIFIEVGIIYEPLIVRYGEGLYVVGVAEYLPCRMLGKEAALLMTPKCKFLPRRIRY